MLMLYIVKYDLSHFEWRYFYLTDFITVTVNLDFESQLYLYG